MFAAGAGMLEADLAPGLYTVTFQAGLLARAVHVALEPGRGIVRVTAPVMDFSSPMPLYHTRTTRPEHEQNAREHSMNIHTAPGSGSQLFLFARTLEHHSPTNPATGLTLHNQAGHLLVDIVQQIEWGGRDLDEAAWCGCTVQLDPGVYRLRARWDDTEVLEQAVVTCAGWQTQIFLLRHFSPVPNMQRDDLFNAAVCMVPEGSSFDAQRDDFRSTELARLGLAHGRAVMTSAELARLSWSTAQNPMLGIYSGHMLLLAPEPDRALLSTIITTLRDMLGWHPDVEALNLWLRDGSSAPPVFLMPPMLRQSWQIIVQASAQQPELVPAGSFAAQMAAHTWGDGAWLTWQHPPAVDPEPVPAFDLTQLQQLPPALLDMLSDPQTLQNPDPIAKQYNLTTLEHALLDYLVHVNHLPRHSPSAAHYLTASALVEAMSVPRAAIDMAAAGLLQKMTPAPVSRQTLLSRARAWASSLLHLRTRPEQPESRITPAYQQEMATAETQAVLRVLSQRVIAAVRPDEVDLSLFALNPLIESIVQGKRMRVANTQLFGLGGGTLLAVVVVPVLVTWLNDVLKEIEAADLPTARARLTELFATRHIQEAAIRQIALQAGADIGRQELSLLTEAMNAVQTQVGEHLVAHLQTRTRMFLSHAPPDQSPVETWAAQLSQRGFQSVTTVQEADIFLLCLSKHSLSNEATLLPAMWGELEAFHEKPAGEHTVMLARLEDCTVPESLHSFSLLDLFREDGWQSLLRAIIWTHLKSIIL
jgi:hypothetical protein